MTPEEMATIKLLREKTIDECAGIARYTTGCLKKNETWALSQDAIHDKIEEAILALLVGGDSTRGGKRI